MGNVIKLRINTYKHYVTPSEFKSFILEFTIIISSRIGVIASNPAVGG
jgi:hypothetical protein